MAGEEGKLGAEGWEAHGQWIVLERTLALDSEGLGFQLNNAF